MDKWKIGNLTHERKKCNCGKTATIYIFNLKDKERTTVYKCNDCDKLIKEIIQIVELTIKN